MGRRIFVIDNRNMPDPNENWSIEEVQRSYGRLFPDIVNAEPHTETVDGNTVVSFVKKVGTKGAGGPLEKFPRIVVKGVNDNFDLLLHQMVMKYSISRQEVIEIISEYLKNE